MFFLIINWLCDLFGETSFFNFFYTLKKPTFYLPHSDRSLAFLQPITIFSSKEQISLHNHPITTTQPPHHNYTATSPQLPSHLTTTTQPPHHNYPATSPQLPSHLTTTTQPPHHNYPATSPQLHNHPTTTTQPPHHNYTTTPPQLHSHLTITTQPPHHNYTTTLSQLHNPIITTTQPHHHNYTTTSPQLHNHTHNHHKTSKNCSDLPTKVTNPLLTSRSPMHTVQQRSTKLS